MIKLREEPHSDSTEYIPALRYHWLSVFYDPLLRWTLRESVFKNQLVKQAGIEGSQRVLDLGCGTGTLTLLIKTHYPEAAVIGVDADARVLNIATAKAAKAERKLKFVRGMAFELPYSEASFDRVLSSLLFHHLTGGNKERTFKEILRVLRPGGELHVADWGKATNWPMRIAFLPVQVLDGFEATSDNVNGLLPELFCGTGFVEVEETIRYTTIVGTLSLYKARKSS